MSVLLADIDATCAALGYSDGQRYQAEPDAAEGLKHLIWILRRDLDNHEYRRHLGRAKVLQTDLVYMLPDYVHHEELSDLLIRLLVILTNPTLLLYREGPPSDNHGRKVFMELIDILQGYKAAFAKDKIWTALFDKLKQALEIGFAIRSEEQNLLIERILVLVRNVLQVPANPEAECRADNDASLHDQVIWALHQTGMLDLVLFVISSPDEEQFHLHGLEIVCLLYREQSAESLADASLQRSLSEKQRDQQELLAARRRERARRQARPPTGRHSRFGGTYVIRNMKSVSDRDVICHQALERVSSIDFDREKQQQKRSHRHIKEEAQVTRRSAFTVRLCLREYCTEVLRSAYNTLVRQVRRVLERNAGSSSHDDSYLLWAIRFFMEFNRLSGLQLQLVSESLSVQCFHWVLTRMQHDMDMIVSDKKQARLWAKRLHVALLTFRELLQSLLALQKLKDDNARALFDMLLNNVCYVLEYRETILHLLMNYNEAHSTKVFLRDVVETANVFIKMMERFCQDSVVVQDKRRGAGGRRKKQPKAKSKQTAAPQPTEDELSSKWAEMASEVCTVLFGELVLPEDERPIPFDAASDKSIDDQREDCMIRINKLLRTEKLEQAIALLRAAREVWPENEVFGAVAAAPKDELLLLREIFMHNITTVEPQEEDKEDEDEENDDDDDAENEEFEEQNKGLTEKTFKFDDFARRLLHPKIVRACTLVLTDWAQIPTRALKAAVTVLHRIAYGCSCPGMLFQAKLFRIFQQVLSVERDVHQEELRRLGIYVVRKFVEVAPTNPKIYAELLFYKGIREANELETGYCDAYESGTKGTWSEEQETELRFLFEENQRNPETDKDVIDWILDNLADKTRTRRGVLKKMKEMGLLFKAPTKRSTKSAQSGKNLWQPEEDEMLRSLYDQYRTEPDCLERLVREFGEQRSKQQIIKRMLQIHLIADKSEILPAKSSKGRGKGKSKRQQEANSDSGSGSGSEADEYMEEPMFEDAGTRKPQNKSRSRQVVRTPLDVGTVQALIAQVDTEKYQPAFEWLTECLNDASDDTDEPAEDDDGVPLLPLQQSQKDAMEDGNFQKVLVALGMQPPIAGMENYWRVPTYLNAADLKLRAKIVSGEEVEIEPENIREEDVDEEDDEEDYLDKRSRQRQQAQAENITAQQQSRLDSLMFSKSDDDDQAEQRAALKRKGNGKQAKRQRKGKAKAMETKESDDEEEKEKETEQPSRASTDDLFEQLKAKRATKIKLGDMVLNESTKAVGDEDGDGDDDAFNFNSEDYRARLLELEDEDEEDEAEEKNKENNTTKSSSLSLQRARRVNVIDSDSDNDDAGGASPADKTNKRPRSDDGQESDEAAEEGDDDANFLARKKPAKVDTGSGEPAKRRRVAIIDDDDDEF
ncbi:GL24394 [Drosophila persimilis]|uniref:GL24394 n=1 Tax=Drosophila persimilis TaxID=7234 RepID=B4G5M5_DROPE|nr:GL24394 [Drosophila persimilis]